MSTQDETLDIRVDRNKCCGYGICVELCPQVFQLDDLGFASTGAGKFGAEFRDVAAEAADSCPEEAITVDVAAGGK